MRPDGDPEHDDYGLPKVDVVIPDDARELERDLIAYRREERRKRRQARLRRVVRPFGRFGVAVPLIAGALLIALISGTLLTVLGPRPAARPTKDPVAGAPQADPGEIGGKLPSGTVTEINGATRTAKSVPDLRSGVIGIVPPDCGCAASVAALAKATNANVLNFWLVADLREAPGRSRPSAQDALKDLRELAGQAHDGLPKLVEDPRNVLADAYGPAPNTRDAGLTAVLVHTDGVVADVMPRPAEGAELTTKIEQLRGPSSRLPG